MTKQQEQTRKLAVTAMLGALAGVLMLFEIPLTFIAPSFYKMDFSEIPVLIGSFSIGPVAGISIELIKQLVKLIVIGTDTGGVGEFANFVIGLSFILPASIIYKYHKNRKFALIGMSAGCVSITAFGALINAFVMLPFYSALMPIDAIIQAGAAINPLIDSVFTFCLFAVAPFNLLKGLLASVVTFFLYKPLSRVIHGKI